MLSQLLQPSQSLSWSAGLLQSFLQLEDLYDCFCNSWHCRSCSCDMQNHCSCLLQAANSSRSLFHELRYHCCCLAKLAIFVIACATCGIITVAFRTLGHSLRLLLQIVASMQSLSQIARDSSRLLLVNRGFIAIALGKTWYHRDCSRRIAASVRSLLQIARSREKSGGDVFKDSRR